MVILILMTVELAGFLGLTGIKLNPVSAVTIITAVGIGTITLRFFCVFTLHCISILLICTCKYVLVNMIAVTGVMGLLIEICVVFLLERGVASKSVFRVI